MQYILLFRFVKGQGAANCPDFPTSWQFIKHGAWVPDSTMTVSCSPGIGLFLVENIPIPLALSRSVVLNMAVEFP